MSSFILLLLGFIGIASNGQMMQCEFKDSGNSGQVLDLTALANALLTSTDDFDKKYDFTPCRGALTCGSDTAMAMKSQVDEPSDCEVMANWPLDPNFLPYLSVSEQRWTFNFTNGNPCGEDNEPYRFFAYFDCDGDVADYRVVSASSLDDCTAQMSIDTKWACKGEIYTTLPPEDDSISPGSVFVIVLFTGFLAYCLIGYIICAILNRKDHAYWDCEANIPHLVFWIKLPTLAIAGCIFTKDFILALMGCDGGSSDKNQDLVSNQSDPEVPNPFATNDDFDE